MSRPLKASHDVAVGNVPDEPGWVRGVPPLAVECADTGQDEEELQAKISDLFAAGTKLVWVVRLVGPRRVEVHEPGQPMRLLQSGDQLVAPRILKNPVPVQAIFDRATAHEVTLRNLLQRQGYQNFDAVRAEGREEGREALVVNALLGSLETRGIPVDDTVCTNVESCRDLKTLQHWLTRAVTVRDAAQLFES